MIPNYEAQKHQVDQRGCSSTHQSPADPSYQGSDTKGGIIQHHQYQYVPRSCVCHIWNLQAKSPHVRKRKTRIVLADGEGLQECNWKDGNHVRYRKNTLPMYYVTWGGSKRILRLSRSSWEHEQQASQVNQGGFTRSLSPINALNKQKRLMRRAMWKPRDILFKIFSVRLAELNN